MLVFSFFPTLRSGFLWALPDNDGTYMYFVGRYEIRIPKATRWLRNFLILNSTSTIIWAVAWYAVVEQYFWQLDCALKLKTQF